MQATVSTANSNVTLPPLAPGLNIRVVVVDSGHRDAPTCASAKVINLDDPKRATYAALSYTWGRSPKSQHILINGEKVHVTPNLFNALQYLRSADFPLTIWIDALCIDQDNHAERAPQVSIMDIIYKNCEVVHIWLGCCERPIRTRATFP
ncbi:heterokaryon incompatibility protein-domain-containing protein [Xylaria acuta]|nr:heterokaryon incompatibility protein-domain-containing protein [Xylaria acuta]